MISSNKGLARKQKAGGYYFCSTYLIHIMCFIYCSVEGYQCTKRSISQVFQFNYFATSHTAIEPYYPHFPSDFCSLIFWTFRSIFFRREMISGIPTSTTPGSMLRSIILIILTISGASRPGFPAGWTQFLQLSMRPVTHAATDGVFSTSNQKYTLI